jgi:hypothetical protein
MAPGIRVPLRGERPARRHAVHWARPPNLPIDWTGFACAISDRKRTAALLRCQAHALPHRDRLTRERPIDGCALAANDRLEVEVPTARDQTAGLDESGS